MDWIMKKIYKTRRNKGLPPSCWLTPNNSLSKSILGFILHTRVGYEVDFCYFYLVSLKHYWKSWASIELLLSYDWEQWHLHYYTVSVTKLLWTQRMCACFDWIKSHCPLCFGFIYILHTRPLCQCRPFITLMFALFSLVSYLVQQV